MVEILGVFGFLSIVMGFGVAIIGSSSDVNLSAWYVWMAFFCGLLGPILIAASNHIDDLEQKNKKNRPSQEQ